MFKRVFFRRNGLEEKLFRSMKTLLRQVDYYEGILPDENLLTNALFEYMCAKGYHFPTLFPAARTIEDFEFLYKQGYAAIINDGKLIGFYKEKAL